MGQVAGMPLGTGMEGARVSRVTGLGKRVLSTIVLLPIFLCDPDRGSDRGSSPP